MSTHNDLGERFRGSLEERREPTCEGECFAPISIGTGSIANVCVALIEAQIYPRDEPAKLDNDIRTLETNDRHDSGKGQIRHR